MSCRKVGSLTPLMLPWHLAALGLLLTGCTSLQGTRLGPYAYFPPQRAIESKDYASFLAENQRQLQRCGTWMECDLPLYNLAFLHAYPESPYRDTRKARRYVAELQARYPHSPWASQGQVLLAFINERSSLEEAQRRLRSELRSRETMIQKLHGQLQRSREIDMEIEKKERELLR